MDLTQNQIKEIAEILDCGKICYVNKITKEIKPMIDFNETYDTEFWEEEFEEIQDNFEDYVKITKMSSREKFTIMKDFVDVIEDQAMQNRLIYALNQNNPFRNFKYELDFNKEIREHWFKFKAYKYEEWVIEYLEENWNEKYIDQNEDEIGEFEGYFNDDGTKINPNLYPLPNLCLSCKKRNNPNEEILCNLTRMDQLDELKFQCMTYELDKVID